MNNLNSVIIEGNLTRDPDVKFTPGGKMVASIGIANNRYFKRQGDWVQEVNFVDVEAWERLASEASEMEKGTKVRVVGRLKQDRWEKDGKSFVRMKIVAENLQAFAAAKKEADVETEVESF
jgi:single-strand DNA-binding protein